MIIHKKTWPVYFSKILSGDKNFEVRLADWKCKRGDTLVLEEWNPETGKYTGRSIKKKVSFVVKTKELESTKMWKKKDIKDYGFQIIGIK